MKPNKYKKQNKWIFVTIFLLPVISFLVALIWLSIPNLQRPKSINIGQLIEPPQPIMSLDKKLQSPMWQLMMLIHDDCNIDCFYKLTVIRDAHWALGKESKRVIRKAIIVASSQSTNTNIEQIKKQLPQIEVVIIDKTEFNKWANTIIKPNFHLSTLVVDPLGNAFLYYDQSKTGNEIIRDLRKLLRYSRL